MDVWYITFGLGFITFHQQTIDLFKPQYLYGTRSLLSLPTPRHFPLCCDKIYHITADKYIIRTFNLTELKLQQLQEIFYRDLQAWAGVPKRPPICLCESLWETSVLTQRTGLCARHVGQCLCICKVSGLSKSPQGRQPYTLEFSRSTHRSGCVWWQVEPVVMLNNYEV